jgi:hypothetical protein
MPLRYAVAMANERPWPRDLPAMGLLGVRPFSAASLLVRHGAYRWTRNPMYLGMVAFLFGIVVCLGTAMPVTIPFAFFLSWTFASFAARKPSCWLGSVTSTYGGVGKYDGGGDHIRAPAYADAREWL